MCVCVQFIVALFCSFHWLNFDKSRFQLLIPFASTARSAHVYGTRAKKFLFQTCSAR